MLGLITRRVKGRVLIDSSSAIKFYELGMPPSSDVSFAFGQPKQKRPLNAFLITEIENARYKHVSSKLIAWPETAPSKLRIEKYCINVDFGYGSSSSSSSSSSSKLAVEESPQAVASVDALL